jgi:hypothetical protein
MPGGTLTYEFGPSDKVWVIYNQAGDGHTTSLSRTGCDTAMDSASVQEGKVIYYRADVLMTETKEWYGVNIKGGSSTRDFAVTDVFPTLNHALVEYENRLAGPEENSSRVRQFVYNSTVPATVHAITHNFGLKEVSLQVYGEDGYKINPENIILQDENTAIVEFDQSAINCTVIVTGEMDYSYYETDVDSVRTKQFVYTSTAPSAVHTVNHNFGIQEVSVQVYDLNGAKILPKSIILVDENTIQVGFDGTAIDCKIVVFGAIDYS